jgi:hypothetical protein
MPTRKRRVPYRKTRGGLWGLWRKENNPLMRTPLFSNNIIDKFTREMNTDIKLFCNYDVLDYIGVNALREQSKLCCMNQINSVYKSNTFEDALSKYKQDVEILCAVDSTNTLVGFIVCELGDCKILENIWSVRLICVKKQKGVNKMSSTLLLAAMMYSIKEIGGKFAILELANGYNNIEGFISYSKMGFIKNMTLYNYRPHDGKICFTDPGNLPMYVSLEHLSQANIVGLANKQKVIRLTHEQDDTGLYEKYKYTIRHPRRTLELFNESYRSNIQRLPNEVALTRQRYAIDTV